MNTLLYRCIACIACMTLGFFSLANAQPIDSVPLDFVVDEALFDTQRELGYLSSEAEKKVFFVNVHNGSIEQEFTFDLTPSSIAINTDSSRLYVALIPEGGNNSTPTDSGAVAELDLETQTLLRQFAINAYPLDIVVSSDNFVFVSDNRDGWINLKSYSLETQEAVEEAYIGYDRDLFLHPDGNRIYTTVNDYDPAFIERFTVENGYLIDGASNTIDDSLRISSPLLMDPDGAYLISGGGSIFSTAPTQEDDLNYQRSLNEYPISDAAFDIPRSTIFTLVDESIQYYNRQSLVRLGEIELDDNGLFISVMGDSLFVIRTDAQNGAHLDKFEHPTLDLATNESPVAEFIVMPDSAGTTQTQFQFDASLSTDDTTPLANLQVRWDWESDGEFDTEFDTTKTATHRFILANDYSVTLEVLDASGFTNTFSQDLSVSFAPDSGMVPETPNSRFEFPHSFTDAAFDKTRRLAYVSSQESKKLFVVNLSNGFIEKEFDFDLFPQSVTITPDGSFLYLTLRTHEDESNVNFEERKAGNIAQFDLTDIVKINQFLINEDPFDIVATDDGFVYITNGSGNWGYLRSYRAFDGEEIDEDSGARLRERIKLHPAQNRIYGTQGSSSSRLERWSIADGSFTGNSTSPSIGSQLIRGDLFISPLGDRMITRGGALISSTEIANEDMEFVSQFLNVRPLEDVLFDSTHVAVFSIFEDEVQFANLNTFDFVNSFSLFHEGQFLSAYGDSLYAFTVEEEGLTHLEGYLNPMLGAKTNEFPVASFTISPESGLTSDEYTFDASASTDIETPFEDIVVRWDWEGDGIWDTPYDSAKIATHQYNLSATYEVKLEVKDEFGFVTTATNTLEVQFGEEEGEAPAEPNEPYHLPFVYTDIVFDSQRPYAYVSSAEEEKIFFTNVQTGLIEKEFAVDYIPDALFQTLDGTKLYALLLTAGRDQYFDNDSLRKSVIAEFDLERQVKTNQFLIDINAYDFVVTSDGYIYASSYAFYPYIMRSFDAATGARIDQEMMQDQSVLELHPDENRIYSSGFYSYDGQLTHWGISEGQITRNWALEYNGNYRVGGAGYVSPYGDQLVTRGGDIFTSAENQSDDLQYVDRLSDEFLYSVTYDSLNATIFTTSEDKVTYYHIDQHFEIGTQPTVATGTDVGVYGDSFYVAIQFSNELALIDPYAHPVLGGKENAFPVADFTISQENGDTQTVFVFDASNSQDAETPFDELQVRWDWESDGDYDTEFSTDKIAEHRYAFDGTKKVTLQVKDGLAFPSTLVQEIEVTFAPDPGSAPDSVNSAYQVPFEITDAAFEHGGNYMYMTSIENQKVYTLNLESGLIEKEYAFGYPPEAITFTQSGERMYVALPIDQNDDQGYYDKGYRGVIAEFDVETQTKIDQFLIEITPEDIVATDDGFLYIVQRVRFSTRLFSIRIRDQLMVDQRSGLDQGTRIKLHPDGDRIYASYKRSSFYEIVRYSIASGRISFDRGIRDNDERRIEGDIFIHPSGDFLVSRGGDVFSLNDNSDRDLQLSASLTADREQIEDAFFDQSRGRIYAAGRDSVWHYDASTFARIDANALKNPGMFAGVYENNLYVLTDDNGKHSIEEFLIQETIVSNQAFDELPEENDLLPNYPNPFNQSTTLKFGLRDASQITIKIYNLMGQEIATLVDSHAQAGYHQYTWNPENLSSGIYFAKMTTDNNFAKTVKLMYVK